MSFKYSLFFLFILFTFLISCKDDENTQSPIIDNNPVTLLPTLSEMNLFSGTLSELNPNTSNQVIPYELSLDLFKDQAKKQRLIRIPLGYKITYNGDGIPLFPDRTLLVKTFYYFNDERDETLGKKILETRVLVFNNGSWESGNYIWNETLTEAILSENSSNVAVDWIDINGATQNLTYNIPSKNNCTTCHTSHSSIQPIGFKLRNLNFTAEGSSQNQLNQLAHLFHNLPAVSTISSLPTWNTSLFSNEALSRAYLDIHCAHCHTSGGSSESPSLDLSYETLFDNTGIMTQKDNINLRVQSNIPGFRMPSLGRTTVDNERITVVIDYLNSL